MLAHVPFSVYYDFKYPRQNPAIKMLRFALTCWKWVKKRAFYDIIVILWAVSLHPSNGVCLRQKTLAGLVENNQSQRTLSALMSGQAKVTWDNSCKKLLRLSIRTR
jgi:hypothetical protein